MKVYALEWEAPLVWLRVAAAPDWSPLDDWRRRWLDPQRGAAADDEDGSSHSAHFASRPVGEGGGYLIEVDFGSAPLDALWDLLDALGRIGALEIELGRSDGSDLGAAVVAELERNDLPQQRLTELVAELIRELPEVESTNVSDAETVEKRLHDGGDAQRLFTTNLFLPFVLDQRAKLGEVRGLFL